MCVLHGGNGFCVHIHLETVDGNWAGKIVLYFEFVLTIVYYSVVDAGNFVINELKWKIKTIRG